MGTIVCIVFFVVLACVIAAGITDSRQMGI
jgi:hypothetical protein